MFKRVAYRNLNARQQEAFNFQKVSSVLADYGFTTIRLSSDWRGADIAQHLDGTTFLKVQLKGRATFEKKYLGRGLYICFPDESEWFLYPHDDLLEKVLAANKIAKTFAEQGGYSFATIPRWLRTFLEPDRLVAEPARGVVPTSA